MINTFSAFFMRRRNWTIPYVLFLAIFVVIPLLLIVYYAFTNDEGMFTFANFRKFMIHPEAINTFVYSVGIALITTILCLLLGYPAAWILSQARFNTSRTMVVLFILPMWVNILIRTLATVALFDFLNFPLGEGALIFGMVYNFLPFMIYPIYNTLQKMDHSLIEAAQDLGFHSLLSLFHEFARNLSDVSCTHDENNVAFFDVVINEFHNFIRIARKQRFDFSG
mgnify:CR=1 FL=1